VCAGRAGVEMVEKQRLKRDKLSKLLEHGMVMVHLDARRAGVSVPEELRDDPHLRLNLSYRFRPCDLELSDEGVQATLTFGGEPWSCRVPFDALFGLTSHVTGESLVWLEDVPEEVLALLVPGDPTLMPTEQRQMEPDLQHAVGDHGSRRGHLRLVK